MENGEANGSRNEEVPEGGGLRRLAASTGSELLEQFGIGRDSDLDRDRVAELTRRLREAVDAALEVPEGLPLEVAGEVARLRAESDHSGDPVAISWNRTRQRAKKTAGVGAVTTVPAMIPLLGPAVGALGLVADWRYVAEQQRDLVLEIAALFDVTLEDPTQEVRTLFVASFGTALTGTQVGKAVGKALAAQVARRSLSRMVPGVGAMVAASLNYLSTVAIGRAAIARFAGDSGVEVRGLIPSAAHPQLSRLRTRIMEAPPASGHPAAPAVDAPTAGSPAIFDREDRRVAAELTDPEREELLDLALLREAAGGRGMAPERERLISEVADVLGFTAEEVEAARRSTGDALRDYAGQVAEIAGSVSRTIARRARDLVGRAWRRIRRKGAGEQPSEPAF